MWVRKVSEHPLMKLQNSKSNYEVSQVQQQYKEESKALKDVMSETQSTTDYESQAGFVLYNSNDDEDSIDKRESIIKQTTKLHDSTVFPSEEELHYPIYKTLAIPKDYKFKDTEEYIRIMNTLERERFLLPIRKAIKNSIFNNESDIQEEEISTKEIEVFKSYSSSGVSFCKQDGLLLNVKTTRMVSKNQENQSQVKGNQLIIFCNKQTNQIHFGKTIIPMSENVNQKNDMYDYENDGDIDDDDFDMNNINAFERIPQEQTFKIQIDINQDIIDFLLNINSIESNYWMISPSDYWLSSEVSLKCIQHFNKNKQNIAFPDETIHGQYQPQFPQYDFLNSKEKIDKHKKKLEQFIKNKADLLDKNQQTAFKHALFNQNTIIQGPPGTGKTFLGCEIVNALLQNYSKNVQKPILVLSKKNKSLDNFIVKLSKFTKSILRLGRRITIDEIQEYSVKDNKGPIKYLFKSKYKWQDIGKDLNSLSDKLYGEKENNKQYIPESIKLVLKLNLIIVLCDNLKLELTKKQRVKIQKELVDAWLADKGFKSQKVEKLLNSIGIKLNEQQQYKLNDLMRQQQQPILSEQTLREEDLINQIRRITSFTEFNSSLRQTIFNIRIECFANKLVQKLMTFKKDLLKRQESSDHFYGKKMSEFMSGFQIIGMTFSGFHMNYKAFSNLKPEIVLVEEASEVLETEFFPILSPWLKHLIQIGDHQQLRPIVKSVVLQKHFNLEKSYFERLISINKAECVTLLTQRRMRPEFADIIRLFYGNKYSDHQSVKNFSSIEQISKSSLYMLSHTFPEKDIGNKSFINRFEAIYSVQLALDLISKHKYKPYQITIICMYSAQYQLVQNIVDQCNRKRYKSKQIEVSTVDKYQGQENDIVILSCVRSNNANAIGFLGIDNRMNVAFSRARKGFICLGNFQMYEENCTKWQQINKIAKEKSSFCGMSIPQNYQTILQKIMKYLQVEKCEFCNKNCHLGECKNKSPFIQKQSTDKYNNFKK